MLKTTPFHARTAPLIRAQTWRRWAGHQVASAYDPQPDREYAAVRNAVAVFDVSPLNKYVVRGPDAGRLLDRMVTRDVTKCRVGQVQYTPWCDETGKVLDDGTISRLQDDVYRLTSAEPNLRWLSMSGHGLDVEVEDVSHTLGALALQGPLARDLLNEVTDGAVEGLKYFRLTGARIGGATVTISRTGYTGDLGYEVWVEAADALPVWDALHAAGTKYGLTPAGIWALDIARIEAGLVMLDVDYHPANRALIEDQKSSPFELNLGWAVSATKGPYTGKRALERERARGPAWGFVGLSIDWDSLESQFRRKDLPPQLPTIAWRASTPVYRDGAQVGYASSGCWSPLLKRYLALAHLTRPHFEPGTRVRMELTVEHRRVQADAVVTKLPFHDPERKRA